MKAEGFLAALGKDDDDDLPRKPRKKAAAAPPAAAPVQVPADQAPPAAPEAASAPPVPEQAVTHELVRAPEAAAPPALTPSQRRAAERRTRVEDDAATDPTAALVQLVQDAILPQHGPGQPSNEPVHKTSVDLRWTLKQGLAELVTRDRRGPKAEINEALELWLRVKGIDVPEWNG